MNREIEFRIYANDRFYYKCLVGNTNDTTDDNWTCPMVWLEDRKEWVNCDNGIIQQYTGLKDKNSEKIFEGDRFWCESEEEYGHIEWDEQMASYSLEFDGWCASFDNFYGKDIEVIGTIFDKEDNNE